MNRIAIWCMEAAVVVVTVAAASFVAVTAIAATAAMRALRCKILQIGRASCRERV